jgi:hypothetical protein
MSTRTKVEEAIKAIKDKGNNTAKEMRTVLKLLLDYTENKETSTGDQQIEFFDYHTNNVVKDAKTGSALQYSCRGIKNQFANFTFKLKIADDSSNNVYRFLLKEDHANELLTTMNTILVTNKMQFSIPFKVSFPNLDNSLAFTIPTTISFFMRDNVPSVEFDMDFFVPGQQNTNINPESHASANPINAFDYPLKDAEAYTSICFHSNQNID